MRKIDNLSKAFWGKMLSLCRIPIIGFLIYYVSISTLTCSMLNEKDFYYVPIQNVTTISHPFNFDLNVRCPKIYDTPIAYGSFAAHQKCCKDEACYCCFYTREPERAYECFRKAIWAISLFFSYLSLEVTQCVCGMKF